MPAGDDIFVDGDYPLHSYEIEHEKKDAFGILLVLDATGFEPAVSAPLRSAQTARPLDVLSPLRPERVIFIFIFYRDILQTPILSCFLEVHSSYLDVSFYHFP